MSGIEKASTPTTVYDYPNLGAEISGVISRTQLETELIPHVVQALIDSGETEIHAKNRVDKSLGEIMRSAGMDDSQMQEQIKVVLHNIEVDLDAKKRTKKSVPQKIQQPSTDVTTSNKHSSLQDTKKPKITISADEVLRRKTVVHEEEIFESFDNENETDFRDDTKKKTNIRRLRQSGIADWNEQTLEWNDKNRQPVAMESDASGTEVKHSDVQIFEPVPLRDIEKEGLASDEKLPSMFHPEQMKGELDRLVFYTKNLREVTGLKHLEAMNEKTEFYETRTKIRQLRSRIKKIKQGTESEDDVAEVKKLWDEMTASLEQLKAVTQKNNDEESVNDDSNETVSASETEIKVGDKYKALIGGVLTIVTIKVLTDKNLFAVTYENDGKELTYTLSADELQPLENLTAEEIAKEKQATSETGELLENSKRKERLVLRNEWKEKKLQFETENAASLQSEKERREAQSRMGSIAEKFAFWKKENKPASLLLSEQAYQLARKEYADQLHTAMRERVIKAHGVYDVKGIVETEQNIDTAFANRFVLKAAHDKAKQEELFVPEGKRSQMLLGMREGLRKHSRAIKYGSIFATTGIAIVSGGFFAGANALLGRTISAKLAAGGAVAGSYLGAYIGSAITQNRENKRNVSMKKAQKGFDVSRIEQFEADYFKNYKAFERAASNERKYAIGGAVIGGLAGSALGGNLDITEALEKIPHIQSSSVLDNLSQKESSEAVSKQFSDRIVASVEEQISPKNDLEVIPKDSSRVLPTTLEDSVSPKADRDHLIKDIEKVLETEPPQSEEVIIEQTTDIHYTFTPGDKINTVSEALCSLIEKNPELISGDMTPGEAVRDFNHEIEHLKNDNPDYYYDLLDQMGISSGDIDEVGAGKTYNFAPLFEYLNSLPE